MFRASGVIAAPVGDIGAPQYRIAREWVPSLRLKCSTPGFDRNDGPSGVCVKGARAAAAVIVSLIPGRAAVVPRRHQRCWRVRNLAASFAAQHQHIQRFTRVCASAVECPDSRSEADRGAVAPEPKEWS